MRPSGKLIRALGRGEPPWESPPPGDVPPLEDNTPTWGLLPKCKGSQGETIGGRKDTLRHVLFYASNPMNK